MKKYKHVIFDLDHTLWDYESNAKVALEELYDKYELGSFDVFDKRELVLAFLELNESLWDDYNHGRIDKRYIREERFKLLFDSLNLPLRHYPYGFEKEYLFLCPTKPHKIPFADEILEYLSPKYELHIITNGFEDVQSTKLKSAGIDHHFKHVFTSETIGHKKPSPLIFEHALEVFSGTSFETIMIGDNLSTDIQGALNASIDQIFFNPSSIDYEGIGPNKLTPTFEVKSLEEITSIL